MCVAREGGDINLHWEGWLFASAPATCQRPSLCSNKYRRPAEPVAVIRVHFAGPSPAGPEGKAFSLPASSSGQAE